MPKGPEDPRILRVDLRGATPDPAPRSTDPTDAPILHIRSAAQPAPPKVRTERIKVTSGPEDHLPEALAPQDAPVPPNRVALSPEPTSQSVFVRVLGSLLVFLVLVGVLASMAYIAQNASALYPMGKDGRPQDPLGVAMYCGWRFALTGAIGFLALVAIGATAKALTNGRNHA